MNQVLDLYKPLIGQLAWSVRRGVGTFLTLEFDLPHLLVTEPRMSNAESAKIRRMASRRRVFVEGDWHFWIRDTRWRLRTAGGVIDHDSDLSDNECLKDLEGQRLLSVEMREESVLELTFDLGGKLELGGPLDGEETQWSLYHWQDMAAHFEADGTLTVERKAMPD